jgi:hypothetical protein
LKSSHPAIWRAANARQAQVDPWLEKGITHEIYHPVVWRGPSQGSCCHLLRANVYITGALQRKQSHGRLEADMKHTIQLSAEDDHKGFAVFHRHAAWPSWHLMCWQRVKQQGA